MLPERGLRAEPLLDEDDDELLPDDGGVHEEPDRERLALLWGLSGVALQHGQPYSPGALGLSGAW